MSSGDLQCCSPRHSAAGCDLGEEHRVKLVSLGRGIGGDQVLSPCQAQGFSPRRTVPPNHAGTTLVLSESWTSTADPGNKTLVRAIFLMLQGPRLPISPGERAGHCEHRKEPQSTGGTLNCPRVPLWGPAFPVLTALAWGSHALMDVGQWGSLQSSNPAFGVLCQGEAAQGLAVLNHPALSLQLLGYF